MSGSRQVPLLGVKALLPVADLLPFALELKRFLVEYYSTGMPSSFKSEVEVTDPVTGDTFERTIEVNEPLRYKGVTVYQSGFDDGGSILSLKGYPLVGPGSKTFALNGKVGETVGIAAQESPNEHALTVQLTELRPINVENLTEGDPQPKAMIEHVAAVTGSAANKKDQNLKNVGPSVNYRVIDATNRNTALASALIVTRMPDFGRVTRGVAPRDHKFPKGVKPSLLVMARTWKAPPPAIRRRNAPGLSPAPASLALLSRVMFPVT